MATDRIDLLDDAFDDHPSLSASLEDFEPNDHRSPLLALPSQHSGFRSDDSEAGADSNPGEPWSPPGRTQSASRSWYRHQPYPGQMATLKPPGSTSRTRETSPQYESAREDDGDLTIPANIPLPRGSLSPVKERSPSPSPFRHGAQDFGKTFAQAEDPVSTTENANNYIRFAVRAEVQHRTEPIDAALSWMRSYFGQKSWSSLSSTLVLMMIALLTVRIITNAPVSPPVPDLVKVAGLARSFEPLLFYSENGVKQIGELQETGVAVWDLGESVRLANMTSAPLIVQELDQLSDSLKTLSYELTRFFANVDGDIDSILIVMEWAKRELSALSTTPLSSLSSAFTNIHTILSRLGILENRSTGLPTALGALVVDLFGATSPQRTHQTLLRTFNEFLSVLEESINSELTYSTSLFSLFESIDRQFLNLHRTVIRESDTQERLEGEFLSSLWVRIIGANASLLRKYEKNKELLSSVRAKTTSNKGMLMEHNGKLMALKGNLESLRRKLVSPLVRRENGSTVGVEEQVRGLESTYDHLRRVREKQRDRVQEVLAGVGAGGRRSVLVHEENVEIGSG
ncbi:hypothetical protein MMC07_003939 [Pseudocyphellaria aurata]|nr:hypothetical protein [Pseudocyphellaria aurata]